MNYRDRAVVELLSAIAALIRNNRRSVYNVVRSGTRNRNAIAIDFLNFQIISTIKKKCFFDILKNIFLILKRNMFVDNVVNI